MVQDNKIHHLQAEIQLLPQSCDLFSPPYSEQSHPQKRQQRLTNLPYSTTTVLYNYTVKAATFVFTVYSVNVYCMHIFLLFILFGILSFSYFAPFVSTDLERKLFTISLYMCIVTIKAYSILFYSILFYSILFYSILCFHEKWLSSKNIHEKRQV